MESGNIETNSRLSNGPGILRKVQIRDWLAQQIVAGYRKRFQSDPPYLADKEEALSEMTRLEAMREINSLDAAGRADLCQRLAIHEEDMAAFLRVLKKL